LNVISTNISLNDDVDSDADIRAFLVEKFARIKKQLPHPPSKDWPTPANIDYLVAKSSGHFIFAATVEKYVGSPKYRHQAVARLKHVLDLRLLPHLEDKQKHPFADLDALYALILRTRNDVDMSVKATAVCLEYPKYFNTISPAELAKVLNIEIDETWAILYELASLFDISEDCIRPFHASFADFLFDSSRSVHFFCIGGDIAADITCAMLRPRRDPEGTRHHCSVLMVNLIDTLLALSYHTFYRLLEEATPRTDLRVVLDNMTPVSIFRRPDASKKRSQRSKGAYYLIPLLRQLESHVVGYFSLLRCVCMELTPHYPSHPTFIRTLSHTSTNTLRYSSPSVTGRRRFFMRTWIGWTARVVSGVTKKRVVSLARQTARHVIMSLARQATLHVFVSLTGRSWKVIPTFHPFRVSPTPKPILNIPTTWTTTRTTTNEFVEGRG